MIWYDMIWYDMIWYDWYDMIWFCNLLDFSTFHLRKSLKRLRYFPAIRDYCWHESVPYLLIVPLIECLFSPHSLTLVLCQASSGADRDAMRHSFLMPAWLKSWLGACAATIQRFWCGQQWHQSQLKLPILLEGGSSVRVLYWFEHGTVFLLDCEAVQLVVSTLRSSPQQ